MITIDVRTLDELAERMRKFPEAAAKAEVLAVNEAARYGRAEGSRQILQEVAFKKSYVSKNLYVKNKARGGRPEAEIEGRFQASSLRQFQTSPVRFGRSKGQSGLAVRVKAGGGARFMTGAFNVKLRAGNVPIGAAFNEGLAIRVKPGETLKGKKDARELRTDKHGTIYLLYGPSVNQVFYTVRDDITPKVQERLTSEYLRQLARLTDG